MSNSFVDEFMDTFQELVLPQEIAGRFRVIECFAENKDNGTYLLSENDTSRLFVLKLWSKAETSAYTSHDAKLLSSISHKGLPKFEAAFENNDFKYTLWEYIDGMPLDQYLSIYSVDREQVLAIVIELCDILTFLHSQPEPIIHRDIKPSNIIINPSDKTVTLIDFGISRKYVEGAASDTFYLGTQEFAPPEQYGFTQTDCRTDIYALGILLRYMLTGKTDLKTKIQDSALERIIQKCSAFSPDKRYKNAAVLKKALTDVKSNRKHKNMNRLIAALTACLLFWFGFLAGWLSIVSKPPEELDILVDTVNTINSVVIFKEPQIEQAVRLALNKDDADTITQNELVYVTHLYFMAEDVADTYEKYNNIAIAYGQNGSQDIGTIYTLEDLSMLPNLREVYFALQPFIDLSPLADCPWLKSLHFYKCKFFDLSPLAECEQLQSLYFDMCSDVRDISPLADIVELSSLEIRVNGPHDLSSIGQIKSLRYLNLWLPDAKLTSLTEWNALGQLEELHLNIQINSLEGIELFQSLRVLSLESEAAVRDLSLLNSLSALKKFRYPPERESGWSTLERGDLELWW